MSVLTIRSPVSRRVTRHQPHVLTDNDNLYCLEFSSRDNIVNHVCLLFIIPSPDRPNIGRLLNFIIINTAWRDFEIKFMIFNLNSFKVLGPLAIMVHTWTLGGDLSTGNWNENLNGKLWFWIWKSHGAHKEYFSFYCMLMNYGKNRVLWVSNVEVMTTWWPNILPPNPRIQKYINQSIMEATSHYISTLDDITTSIWGRGADPRLSFTWQNDIHFLLT